MIYAFLTKQDTSVYRLRNYRIPNTVIDPVKVIEKQNENIESDLQPNDVLVKMIASPVNPADINTIQGKYPVRPTLPSIPGNEGVGEVVAVGKSVQKITVGDRVVPLIGALGTWRTHIISASTNLYKIPKKLGIVEAATLTVNPCTAFRMLRDFVDRSQTGRHCYSKRSKFSVWPECHPNCPCMGFANGEYCSQ